MYSGKVNNKLISTKSQLAVDGGTVHMIFISNALSFPTPTTRQPEASYPSSLVDA